MKKLLLLITILTLTVSCSTVLKKEYSYYTEEITTHKDGTVHKEIRTNMDETTGAFYPDKRLLEVYTYKNIYYIDIVNFTIKSENSSNIIQFDYFEELYMWLGETTARESNCDNYLHNAILEIKEK